MKQQASSIIIAVMMTGLMSLVALGWWQRASMSFDIVTTREEYYTNLFATEACFDYLVTFVKKHFDQLFHEEVFCYNLTEVAKKSLLRDTRRGKERVRATGRVMVYENALRLIVDVFSKNHALCSVQALLVKRLDSDAKRNTPRFFIEHYTLGTSV